MVSLESLDWENARSVIKGRVLVHNVAFEKSIMVRMSFNHWQTWIDVEATYKESLNGALDRFSFELVTPNHLSYLNLINTSSSCSMAIRYQVNGQEYWDNNNQNNFNVQWVSCGGNKITKRKDVVVKPNPISFYPAYNQEQEIKKEEYTTRFLTGMYIAPSCNDKSNYLSTQQQISVHFQSYLDNRQRQTKYSVKDHNAIMSVPSPPPSPLLIPPSRNDLVLT
ncbi:putative phosphatase regulatory subunit-domain-containing protein [Thamnidium elegans]|nr:putative phosphatase regulatory subunit-domain-containing protein [Thamnidium elegans]